MKLFWTIAALMFAAACTPMQWVKPDADATQADADNQQCQMQAWQEARWREYSYFGRYSMMYRDSFGRPFLTPYSPFRDPFGERFMEESRLTNYCMRAKGYELQPTK